MTLKRLFFLRTSLLLASAGITVPIGQSAIASSPPASRTTGIKVVFNRDIRPILSDNCFACHGPDKNKRQANLRLDQPNPAIVPGSPNASELIKRIVLAPADAASMPPASFHKKLTAAQISLMKRWVQEGAVYQKHWAYELPVKAQVPASSNAVDYLVHARLASIGLPVSPPADRRTIIRRLYFDLIGLPPTSQEVAAFVADKSPKAYTNLVERLLANTHYGERMAQGWLDVVRFADTIGYHSDNPRNIWPYRDYVINSFNTNKRFDRFTREQLAGDLLPDANQESRVGSAFNRLLLTTEEGGAQAKDYEARYLTDRVRSLGTVWLGQTTGCCQCHDHKFDPLRTRDFYTLGAFFADVDEAIIGGREPGMLVPSAEQSKTLQVKTDAIASLKKSFDGAIPAEFAAAKASWDSNLHKTALLRQMWRWMTPSASAATNGVQLVPQPDGSILATGPNPDKTIYTVDVAAVGSIGGVQIETLPDASLPQRGPGRAGNGNFVITEVIAQAVNAAGAVRNLPFGSAQATFEQAVIAEANPYRLWSASSTIDGDQKGEEWGWAILPNAGKPQSLILALKQAAVLAAGEKLQIIIKQNHGAAHNLGRFRIAVTESKDTAEAPLNALPADIALAASKDVSKRTVAETDRMIAYFKEASPEFAPLRKQIVDAQKSRDDYEASIPRCLISVHRSTPRTVRVLPRGNWMDETGDVVQPATPAFLPGVTGGTRLDLANWIVSRQNPLPARTVMNRLWKQFFGNGLSKVLEDLGAQGEPPANPALLDYLACEFMDSGWDIKHMVRLIVNSNVYRQTSIATPLQMQKDPYNREYARQGRFRLDAEEIRDNALSVSGLLSLTIGGPSVKPYQPDRYWDNLNFPVRDYVPDKGDSQYRRGIYTWWQRSFLHPSMLAFDAPSREECAADRGRSNIPQQALVLLNDPSYVEADRAFAVRAVKECTGTPEQRISWMWNQALQRQPTTAELKTVMSIYRDRLAEYQKSPEAAKSLLSVGFAPLPADCNPPELAALTHTARIVMNLHETITRE